MYQPSGKLKQYSQGSVDSFGTLWWDIYRTASLARGTPSLGSTKEKQSTRRRRKERGPPWS
jgi:hypothetical protein